MDRFVPRWKQEEVIQPSGNKVEREEDKEAAGVAPPRREIPKPLMGVKARRITSIRRDNKGDYLDVPSSPSLSNILSKRGDQMLLFADKVLKFTGSGKMKRCVMMITDRAIYLVDPDVEALKRRIELLAVDKICLSKLNDNFFALIVPKEYDCLMVSTRKTEILTVLGEATKGKSNYEIGVAFSNRFDYHSAADTVKEVLFEEVAGTSCLTLYELHRLYFTCNQLA
ncbi:uncharacterized protein [Typha latifolia]|uniref:uncharacterized protein isoform X2 n=1 Tax=Typha latifolia TaxID=4733 RepID=UPI003C2CE24A